VSSVQGLHSALGVEPLTGIKMATSVFAETSVNLHASPCLLSFVYRIYLTIYRLFYTNVLVIHFEPRRPIVVNDIVVVRQTASWLLTPSAELWG